MLRFPGDTDRNTVSESHRTIRRRLRQRCSRAGVAEEYGTTLPLRFFVVSARTVSSFRAKIEVADCDRTQLFPPQCAVIGQRQHGTVSDTAPAVMRRSRGHSSYVGIHGSLRTLRIGPAARKAMAPQHRKTPPRETGFCSRTPSSIRYSKNNRSAVILWIRVALASLVPLTR